MSIYLGVDAGGSKTHAVITDDKGNVLGKGIAGNGNHQVHRKTAAINIETACNAALQEAGVAKELISFAYFGLAGADREPDYEILRPMIAALGFPRYEISCDTMIGMRAGTNHSYGAAIISGTGFNSAARNEAGEELQYGGFGFQYGDGNGSGSGLSVLAFRAVIRAWDGRGPDTLLTSLVLKHMGYSDVEAMYENVLYGRVQIPRDLVKVLFDAANQHDEVAIGILINEGEELANAVCTLIRRLGMARTEFDVVFIGSVLNRASHSIMNDVIARIVAIHAPFAHCVKLTSDPVAGAVMSAMDADGRQIDAETEAKLKSLSF